MKDQLASYFLANKGKYLVLEKGLHYTNVVVFESLDGIGILLDRILCNWVEQEREKIKGLNWEE